MLCDGPQLGKVHRPMAIAFVGDEVVKSGWYLGHGMFDVLSETTWGVSIDRRTSLRASMVDLGSGNLIDGVIVDEVWFMN